MSESKSPNLDYYRRRAKALLKLAQSGDPAALQRFTQHHPDFRKDAAGVALASENLALNQAQLVIARENGFSSWPRLKAYVDAMKRSASQTPEDHLQSKSSFQGAAWVVRKDAAKVPPALEVPASRCTYPMNSADESKPIPFESLPDAKERMKIAAAVLQALGANTKSANELSQRLVHGLGHDHGSPAKPASGLHRIRRCLQTTAWRYPAPGGDLRICISRWETACLKTE